MILLIDNYDSFTYNLVHFLGELGAETSVYRNDKITPQQVLAKQPEAIVLSPGPSVPDKAGICLELVRVAADAKIPTLGICLGHQTIGQAFGGKVVSAPEIVHGKVSQIQHKESGIFAGLPNPFIATRYHSLVVERESLPDELMVTAETSHDGGPPVIMGLAHRDLPIFGAQFHPESIASQAGHALLANFLEIATGRHVDALPEFERVDA